MKLRSLVVAAALLVSSAVVVKAQETTPLFVYIDGDTNIQDLWNNTIVPAFETEFPQYDVEVVVVRGVGGGNGDIADRALAALETGDDPQADFLETIGVESNPAWLENDLFLELTEENVPNLANLNEAAAGQRLAQEAPYRGSQVLLAYNSDVVAEEDVPTTYAELIEWINANPGRFVYNRPDRGGSGNAMVSRAIWEVTGQDPSLFVPGEANEELLAQYPAAWELLASIHDSIYEGGAYPGGNLPVIELLANGSVDMITAWSDQAIQNINLGVLPPSTRLAQLQDLPFSGGYAQGAIP
ncbi:MAG: extracellular solute-binding protein, partial [Blastochloris sp.]|nr:extracellular solute-binding protein [Blastochloris sp.]